MHVAIIERLAFDDKRPGRTPPRQRRRREFCLELRQFVRETQGRALSIADFMCILPWN
jgi:hypothetical protein